MRGERDEGERPKGEHANGETAVEPEGLAHSHSSLPTGERNGDGRRASARGEGQGCCRFPNARWWSTEFRSGGYCWFFGQSRGSMDLKNDSARFQLIEVK